MKTYQPRSVQSAAEGDPGLAAGDSEAEVLSALPGAGPRPGFEGKDVIAGWKRGGRHEEGHHGGAFDCTRLEPFPRPDDVSLGLGDRRPIIPRLDGLQSKIEAHEICVGGHNQSVPFGAAPGQAAGEEKGRHLEVAWSEPGGAQNMASRPVRRQTSGTADAERPGTRDRTAAQGGSP